MSILKVDNIRDNGSGFNDVVSFQNVNGTENGRLCRAFVNFNGQGAVAIRANFNVNSITDNGTGDYTINHANSMSDANYSVSMMNSYAADSGGWPAIFTGLSRHTINAGSFRIQNGAGNSGTLFDSEVLVTATFR